MSMGVAVEGDGGEGRRDGIVNMEKKGSWE